MHNLYVDSGFNTYFKHNTCCAGVCQNY